MQGYSTSELKEGEGLTPEETMKRPVKGNEEEEKKRSRTGKGREREDETLIH